MILFALAGQLYAFTHPGYSNTVLAPDPDVGWTLAPNIEFINTGDHWYAEELSPHHKTNSLGFLGPERSIAKPDDTVRIAIMGDSFVEALQVPLEKSAAGVLEQTLNSSSLDQRFEVFNFGVSNLSVGQYLLIYEKFARQFSPDYVFIFVTSMQMKRTVEDLADLGVKISNPRFEVVDGKLVRHPVTGFNEAKKIFEEKIHERGGRTVKRKQKLFITDWIKQGNHKKFVKGLIPAKIRLSLKQMVTGNTIQPFWPALKSKISRLLKGEKPAAFASADQAAKTAKDKPALEIEESVLKVNLKVIEEMSREVTQNGGKLILVDASLYFWFQGANEILTERLRSFAEQNNIPYIPLYQDLLATDRNNIWARFEHSHHFNEHGNRIFARNMYQWLIDDLATPHRSDLPQ